MFLLLTYGVNSVTDIVDIINSSFQTISDDILKNYLGETNGTLNILYSICIYETSPYHI